MKFMGTYLDEDLLNTKHLRHAINPFCLGAMLHIENTYSVAVYHKYLTRLGELIILEPWRENYHFSQPS